MHLKDRKDNSATACMFAILDLQGFSSHLDLANSDFRTELGAVASRRLDILEMAVNHLLAEKEKLPYLYPKTIELYRLNDALYIYCDLPDQLCPDIGSGISLGISPKDLVDSVPNLLELNEDEAVRQINETIKTITSDSMLFVGAVSRTFTYINKKRRGDAYAWM